jgi:hypothetical protein
MTMGTMPKPNVSNALMFSPVLCAYCSRILKRKWGLRAKAQAPQFNLSELA